jgi:hypothetical protein
MSSSFKAIDAITAAARSALCGMQHEMNDLNSRLDRTLHYLAERDSRIAELEAAEVRSKSSALRADLLQDALACQQEEIDRLRAALRAYQPGDGDTEEGPPPPCEDEFLRSPVSAKTKKIRKDKATPVVDDEKEVTR